MEYFRVIQGTKGLIQISDLGNVRSYMRGYPHLLKTQVDDKGYHRFSVTIDGKKRTYKLHREVAKAFIPNPDNLPQVNHRDGNKNNNCVANLEWVTNRENAYHAIEHGLWDSVLEGAKKENERRKKPIIAYRIDGEYPCTRYYESISEAERDIGSRHITAVLKGKRTHAKGWAFQYAKEVMPCQP
jgi:hypothetical protein